MRLRLARSGAVLVECTPLHIPGAGVRVKLAMAPVSRDDVFLYHKTTNRAVYDQLARAGLDFARAADDVILWNAEAKSPSRRSPTWWSSSTARRVTPPVECGLLAGTFRAELLDRGELSERIVTIDELRCATRIWLINSVQGWRSATLTD